ncbi:hypothetical protein EC412_19760 [Salmonella enterica subsp. enterica serovar Redlands]|nr:hypothetical protein [Salmonella enterica subsp. enterica serovar Redlands]
MMMKNTRLWPVVVTALTLSACTPKPVAQLPVPATPAPPVSVEVVHTARYTLTTIAPPETLQYPLRQITSHAFPAPKKGRKTPARSDALKLWLSGTGYSLCLPVTDDMRLLFNSPLPDSQHAMGPLRTETALQVIAGPAWTLSVDEITRTVCFARAPFTQTLS